jgi:small subunit ribosomal protein S14
MKAGWLKRSGLKTKVGIEEQDLEAKGQQLRTEGRQARQKEKMATTAKIAKTNKKPKFSTQHRNRCSICGRPRAFLRKFGLCRLCFRGLALKGEVPGVMKSSW